MPLPASLSNSDDAGARYHLARVVKCVKAAATTLNELEGLKRDAANARPS